MTLRPPWMARQLRMTTHLVQALRLLYEAPGHGAGERAHRGEAPGLEASAARTPQARDCSEWGA